MPATYDLGTASGKVVIDYDGKGADAAQKGMEDVGKSAKNLDSKLAGTQQVLNKTGNASLVAGTIIAGGFALAVKSASDFEFQMSAIQAVSGATADEMDLISAAALRIGKDTAFSASEAASAMEELVKAGISTTDVLNGAADATVALAAAGGVDLPTAAGIAANAMNQFGLAAEDLVAVTDTIAGAANASAIDVHQFADSLAQVGAVANLAGLSFDDTALAIAAMGNAGIKGSDAGTSLKQVLLNLNPTTEKQTKLMRQLGLITEDGTNNFYDQAGSLKDLKSISGELEKALAGMSDQQKQATLETLFGTDAIRGAAVIASTGAEGFDKLAESIGKVSAADVAAERMDNLKGTFEALKGSIETLAIQIGQLLLPAITAIVNSLITAFDWFISLDGTVKAAIASFGLLAAGLLIAYGVVAKGAASFLALRDALLLATGATTLFGNAGAVAATKTKLLAAAQLFLNTAMKANPILLIVGAVLALVAAYAMATGKGDELAKSFAPIFDAVDKAGKALAPVIGIIVDAFADLVEVLATALTPILDLLVGVLTSVLQPIFEALAPIITALAEVLGAILTPALKILAPAFEVIGKILEVVFKILEPFIDLIMLVLTPILDLLVIALTAVADALSWVADQIAAFFETSTDGTSDATRAWDEFASFITDIWEGILSFFSTIAAWIDANLVQPIAGFIMMIVQRFQEMAAGISAAWQAVMDFIAPVIAWFQEFVVPLIQAVIDLIVAIFTYLGQVIAFVWEGIVAAVTTAVQAVSDFIATVWGAIIGFLAPIFQAIYDFVSGIFQKVYDFVSGIVQAVASFISDVWNGLVQIVSDIFTNVYEAIKDPIDDVLGIFEDMYNNIIDFFTDAGTWLMDIGGMIIGGLIDGIEGALGGLTDILNNITGMIPKEKGPEDVDKKLLTPAGRFIMQGLISGIRGEIPELQHLLGGLTASIPDSITSHVNGTLAANGGDTRVFTYNAAPGGAQLSGEQAFFEAIKRSKVVVPGWAG